MGAFSISSLASSVIACDNAATRNYLFLLNTTINKGAPMNGDIKNDLRAGALSSDFTRRVKTNLQKLILAANGPNPSQGVKDRIDEWVNTNVTIDFITQPVAGFMPASGLFEFDITFAKDISPGLSYFYKFSNAVNKIYGWKTNSGLLTGQKYYLDPTIDNSKKSPNNIVIQNIKFSDIEFDVAKMDQMLLEQMQNQGFLKNQTYENIFAASPPIPPTPPKDTFRLFCLPPSSSQDDQELYYNTGFAGAYTKYAFQSRDPKYKAMIIGMDFPQTSSFFVNKTLYKNRTINFEIIDIPDTPTQKI